MHDLVNSGLLPAVSNGVFPDGYSDEAIFVTTMEDGVSYRFAGVPYFLNGTGMRVTADGWYQQHYHTPSDDESTYNADVMATNINLYGILGSRPRSPNRSSAKRVRFGKEERRNE